MKKAIAIVFALVLVFSLFACGTAANTATQSGSPAAPPPSGASPASPGETSDAPSTAPAAPVDPLNTDTAGKPTGGIMRIVCTAEGANPIGVPWLVFGVDTALLIPVCETLVFERTNGDIVPFLASSYKIDLDNKQVVLDLRQGIKFTDGSDFNADAVVWNLLNDKKANYLSTAVTDVVKLGDYQVGLKFEKYANDILSALASHSNAVISKASYEKNGEEWAKENPVGTGPFMLKSYTHGASISYTKNSDYWQKGKPYLDGIEYEFIRDVMTQNVAMQSSGEQSIDVLDTTNGEQVATLKQMGFNVNLMPIGPISLVPSSLDQSSPLSKKEVREAISYCLDRQSIVDARGFDVLTPAYQFIGPAWNGHLPDSYNLSYNLDKAKELMKQAGYPDGFTTTLYAQPALADKDAAVAIQSMLGQIGIKAELQFPDSGGYSAIRKNGWDGLLIQHTRSLTQIVSSFNFYFGKTQMLLSSLWYPDNMEAAIQEAMTTPDNKTQLETLSKMIYDNMLIVPVYNLVDCWIAKANIQGADFTNWGSSTMYLAADAYMTK
ncbi:extracellular solute-binding protein, family 5 Middle [Sporobacter termitidis DSM 10068]|uniref:Extracellular solute-binding protein, family 5 Middle n=1 Tax=Sporobacter termitidis DSM 10068 TaxID=1123282 RepID=A0A1M5YZR5_9FIRM|nr:ABC transporter substrate-binding protein [Sporobacter termitidis]SHI17506.1 extracellular solute-binding protein, family 5 Middle [Sporobacter termitidis DSM 10068]